MPDSALFYHTANVTPAWTASFRPVAQVGSHVFMRRPDPHMYRTEA